MPQVDFGNLYKFMASLGLVLVAGSIAIPWLVAQSMAPLLVSEESIAGLPTAAGQAILSRQQTLAWLQQYALLPASCTMLLVGGGLLIWALRKWYASQELLDAGEALTYKANALQFERLTEQEVEAKLKDEVAVTAESEAGSRLADRKAAGAAPESEERLGGRPTRSTADEVEAGSARNASLVVEYLRRVETQVAVLLTEAYGGEFRVEREVRVTAGGGSGRSLDVLLNPIDDRRAQLGVEVKRYGRQMSASLLNQMMLSTAIATQDIRGGELPTEARGIRRLAIASGVLVLVLNEQGIRPNLMRVARHAPAINSALRRPVGVLVVSEGDLFNLSSVDMKEAVSAAWVSPDQVVRATPS